MPEQEHTIREIAEGFEEGKPLIDSDWEDMEFTSSPEGWEGRMERDFMYFKHIPCGQICLFTGPQCHEKKFCPAKQDLALRERLAGVEGVGPSSQVLETRILPLNYTPGWI